MDTTTKIENAQKIKIDSKMNFAGYESPSQSVPSVAGACIGEGTHGESEGLGT